MNSCKQIKHQAKNAELLKDFTLNQMAIYNAEIDYNIFKYLFMLLLDFHFFIFLVSKFYVCIKIQGKQ